MIAVADKTEPDGIVLTEAQKKRRRERSIAIALALGVPGLRVRSVTMLKSAAALLCWTEWVRWSTNRQ